MTLPFLSRFDIICFCGVFYCLTSASVFFSGQCLLTNSVFEIAKSVFYISKHPALNCGYFCGIWKTPRYKSLCATSIKRGAFVGLNVLQIMPLGFLRIPSKPSDRDMLTQIIRYSLSCIICKETLYVPVSVYYSIFQQSPTTPCIWLNSWGKNTLHFLKFMSTTFQNLPWHHQKF